MTEQIKSFTKAKRRIGEFVVNEMINAKRYDDYLSDREYFARIDGKVYAFGSQQDWDHIDDAGTLWNQDFSKSEEVADLPNEPDDYSEWQEWNKQNRLNKQSNNPYWDGEQCKEDKKNFANAYAEDWDFIGDPLEDDELNEYDVDVDFDFEITA